MVMLRDGRTLIAYLRSLDQFGRWWWCDGGDYVRDSSTDGSISSDTRTNESSEILLQIKCEREGLDMSLISIFLWRLRR